MLGEKSGLKDMVDIRNTVLHGNFEQAARQAGVKSKEEYFKTFFVAEIERFYEVVNNLVDQIDPTTGIRKKPII